MKALSVRQPWAWALVAGWKDVENRTWRTSHRGLLLIHAGKRWDPEGKRLIERLLGVPAPHDLPLGAIVGVVEIVGCVTDADSPWAIDDHWHFQVANARQIAPTPSVGRLGLFEVDPDPTVVEAVSVGT